MKDKPWYYNEAKELKRIPVRVMAALDGVKPPKFERDPRFERGSTKDWDFIDVTDLTLPKNYLEASNRKRSSIKTLTLEQSSRRYL